MKEGSNLKKKKEKSVVFWGTGFPKREFLYSDDLADALLFLMKKYNSSEIINIGTGKDISIKELSQKIKKAVGYEGGIEWDRTKPDGSMRKLLNTNKLNRLGWKYKTDLDKGLIKTISWFNENAHKQNNNRPKS